MTFMFYAWIVAAPPSTAPSDIVPPTKIEFKNYATKEDCEAGREHLLKHLLAEHGWRLTACTGVQP